MAHTVVDTISIHHRITVLCGRPSYDPTERHPWRPYQTENVDLVRIIRAGSTEFPRFNMKNRLMNYLSYVMLALPRALFLNCDVVLAMTDPPFQGIVGAFRGGFSFVLLHAGNLGFYGAWNTLVTAARKLSKEGVAFVFVGDGAERPAVQAAAAGADNIRFLDYFPAAQIPSVLAAADAHIVTVKRGLEGVVVPSKMYGILAAGKPIVAVAPRESDVRSLGVKQGFAVAAAPDNHGELVSVIRHLMADGRKLQSMEAAARAAAPSYD